MYQKMWNETGVKNGVVMSTYAVSVKSRATLVRCIVKNSATILEDLNFWRHGMLTL